MAARGAAHRQSSTEDPTVMAAKIGAAGVLIAALIGGGANVGVAMIERPVTSINCVEALEKAIALDAKSTNGHIKFRGPEEDACGLNEAILQMSGGK